MCGREGASVEAKFLLPLTAIAQGTTHTLYVLTLRYLRPWQGECTEFSLRPSNKYMVMNS
jgi:hypothetical protein